MQQPCISLIITTIALLLLFGSDSQMITWRTIAEASRRVVPALSSSAHKGQMGRIGVLGGSLEYTGAPYYAAKAALLLGADLSYIFCAETAAIPIKTYSPEIMVMPVYDSDEAKAVARAASVGQQCPALSIASSRVIEFFPRMNALVVGPGLGREPIAVELAKSIIAAAVQANLPIVIDADGLWALSQDLSMIQGYNKCVLTPNAVEFERLRKQLMESLKHDGNSALHTSLSAEDVSLQVEAVSRALGGVTVIRKGKEDVISAGGTSLSMNEPGSSRRSGGQGDILAGCLGVLSHWAGLNQDLVVEFNEKIHGVSGSTSTSYGLWAGSFASSLVRKANYCAFSIKRRSMTSPDMLECIGTAYEGLMNDDE